MVDTAGMAAMVDMAGMAAMVDTASMAAMVGLIMVGLMRHKGHQGKGHHGVYSLFGEVKGRHIQSACETDPKSKCMSIRHAPAVLLDGH
jgi:hypothetical protein